MSQASLENPDVLQSLSQQLSQISSSTNSTTSEEENNDTRPQLEAIYYTPKNNPIFIISLENNRRGLKYISKNLYLLTSSGIEKFSLIDLI